MTNNHNATPKGLASEQDVTLLKNARNDAGFMGCRLADIPLFHIPEIDEAIKKACSHHELMLDELKYALSLVSSKES